MLKRNWQPLVGLQSLRNNVVPRRRFLSQVGGMLALSACARGPQSILEPNWPAENPQTLPGEYDVNVRDFGALGDGATNDTSAFNAAIQSLRDAGGIVRVPDGTYMIDPVASIRLATKVTLSMAAKAELRAIPTAYGKSAVVILDRVDNARIIGGKIVGERVAHLGTTGEWGMGIRVNGSSNVRFEGVETSDCWGDGIYIGAAGIGRESTNVTVVRCSGRNNRRQGISVTGCVGAVIDGCIYADTNGAAPSAGIDLEPNAGLRVTDIVIRNCTLSRNAGVGILLVNPTVTNVTLESNSCTENQGPGVYLVRGVSGVTIHQNRIEGNSKNGILLEDSHYNELTSNLVRDNSVGQPRAFRSIRLADHSSNNTISDNHLGLMRLLHHDAQEIEVEPDCLNNVVQGNG